MGLATEARYDVLVLGAGASGLMCAMEAAKRGRRVAVLDHAGKAGRKLRLTGGGKCNFTNLDVSAANYVSANPHFCKSALARFDQYAAMEMLSSHGIAWEEREHGRLFCLGSAGEVAGLLTTLCHRQGVDILLDCTIGKVDCEQGLFRAATSQGVFLAPSLVVATGSPAWPQVGATRLGLDIARQFGLAIVPMRPALAPLVMAKDWPLAGLTGISLPVTVQVAERFFSDHLLFTHEGLSGPAALQASLFWRSDMEVRLNFLPDTQLADFLANLTDRKVKLRNALSRMLPARLAAALCVAELGDKAVANLSRAEQETILASVHSFRVTPLSIEGFAKAEVAAGGVDTRGLSSKTMEAAQVSGLYFVGEVLDVTGMLGGYNLQWAWASGFAAGQHV
ncbi:flavoprotein, HI0933 family [Desulfocurvibacter africanus PCS]|uniref:Flavoprotein, HI0933 family n=1 Tax=Desulfocurvibacter africanus PCS TaxID=1262666 RepID=M5PXV3_DESAF|nr:aminoacetone oxidase family FAD-binding enzyme [Desulfocurvibacter africanus]EMG38805.1 flavoprotein, HI0933 family [Desulfocurvibacter africanus PCS]